MRLKREIPFYLMLLPGVVVVFIYSYIPLGGLIMAFQDFDPTLGIFGSPWVGLSNFDYIFSMPDTAGIIFNTFFIAVLKIIGGLAVPVLVALMLNEVSVMPVKRTVQTLIYLPHFLSWVILAGVFIDLLSPTEGIVNRFLGVFGLEPIYFLGDESWFPYTMVLTDVWKEFGFGTIIYLAALTGIDLSLYEAAAIDGANRWQSTWHITLPGLIPTVVLLMTLAMGNVLNAGFDQVFNMYNNIVLETADIIDTYVYRLGLVNLQFSMSTAAGLFKSVVSFILVVTSYTLAYKFADYTIF